MQVQDKGEFSKLLAITSLQFVGIVEGGALPAGGDFHTHLQDGKQFVSYSLSAGMSLKFDFFKFELVNQRYQLAV